MIAEWFAPGAVHATVICPLPAVRRGVEGRFGPPAVADTSMLQTLSPLLLLVVNS